MSKNILILSSSPRRGGNSDTLCDEFMRGAIKSGNQVEKIFLRDNTKWADKRKERSGS